jgi:hypothetical protein
MKQNALALILGGVAIMASGCATSEEWQEWRSHPTHFASGQHMGFSLRNQGENPTPKVTRQDINAAQGELWWGKLIVVSPEQIFER